MVFLCSSDWPKTCYISQTVPKLTILCYWACMITGVYYHAWVWFLNVRNESSKILLQGILLGSEQGEAGKVPWYLCSLHWEKHLCKWDLADGSGHETSSWITWVSPNVLTRVFLREGYEDNVKAEAEIGVIWPQAKECWHRRLQQTAPAGSSHFSLGRWIRPPECKSKFL